MKNYLRYFIILLVVLVGFLIFDPVRKLKLINRDNDIYDVVLFWGQSNMVGCTGMYKSEEGLLGEDARDQRLDELGIDKFSELSGIEKEILEKYTALNHVDVDLKHNTVFDYYYDYDNHKDYFVEVTKDTKTIGKNINARTENGKVVFYNSVVDNPPKNEKGEVDDRYYTLQRSYGTNLTPYFGKVYNELTGHKLVIVLAANNGEEIAHFLPHDRVLELSHRDDFYKNQYIYEAMVDKYNRAIEYLEDNNKKIGNKFYVVFQGEADAKLHRRKQTNKDEYYNTFMEVHNTLKDKLGLSFGVIIETSRTLGTKTTASVEEIHEAQEKLIDNNYDIILGSSYSYDTFVPSKNEGIYRNMSNEKYNEVLDIASLGVSVSPASVDINGKQTNTIHFNAAALSHIGRESAINASHYLNNKIAFNHD